MKPRETDAGSVTDIFENPCKNIPYVLVNDNKKIQDGKIDSDGNVKLEELIPGTIYLVLFNEMGHELKPIAGKFDNGKNMIVISYAELGRMKIELSMNTENLVVINPDTGPASF